MRKIQTIATTLLLLAFGLNMRAQMSDAQIQAMTEASFAAFKANKWASFENGKYWGWQTKDGTGYRYYWEQALCTMALEQQAEYGTSPDAYQMVIQNLDGFVTKYGTGLGLGWNDYIDDIGWVLDAYCVGYRITGKQDYLKYAKLLWNVGFTRGNLGPHKNYANNKKDGSEGLWWRVPHGRYTGYDAEGLNGKEGDGQIIKNQDHYKSPLSTSPHISAGAYLYKFTGDQHFLDGAIKLWQWEVNTLWEYDDDSGIHEGYNPPRPSVTDKDGNTTEAISEGLRSRRTMHDLSSFFEGTNALWKVTGDEVYLAWCWKIVNSVLYHRLDGNSVIQNKFNARDGSWCWEAGRAWTMFCADNNLWDFKGQVPLIEGTYTDYTGKQKTYTSKVQGQRKSIPNGWTLYQFMANSAKEIKDNNATCIILPTKRNMANPWGEGGVHVYGDVVEAEANDGVASKWVTVGASGMTVKATDNGSASGGKYVGYVGKGNYVELYYTPTVSGIYQLQVTYATANTRELYVDLNGKLLTQLTCVNTGGWTIFGSQAVDGVPLVKGNKYTVKLYNDNADTPNIDCVTFIVSQELDQIENMYYVKNIGQQKYIKTDKSAGYDMPGLVDKTGATPQVITEEAGGTYLIASPSWPAGWGVQGRNTIYETNNGSQNTNSWGTSLTPGWQIVKTGQKEDGYDVVYLKYTWGNYTAGNTNVTNPAGKTFVLHYGAYDLSTDGWNATQLADVANPWCYGGLESNLQSYGNNAKWVIIPLTSDRVQSIGDSNERTDDTVDALYIVSLQKVEAESGTFKQPDGDMAGRPDAIKTVSGSQYSGGKKITNFGGLNWAEYTVSVDETDEYQMCVAYAIGNASHIEVTIDGQKKNIPVESTGSKDVMKESRNVQFSLSKGSHKVELSYTDDEGADLDYFLLKRVTQTDPDDNGGNEPGTGGEVVVEPEIEEPGGQPATVSITIPQGGKAVYSIDKPLDFSNVVGVKAYVANGYNAERHSIMQVSIAEVPAQTGLLLKGTPGTYVVPVQSNDWYVVSFLKPVATKSTVGATEGSNVNYWLTEGSSGLAFYRVSGQVTLEANTAYLSVPAEAAAGVRVVSLQFDDETNGITQIVNAESVDSQCYDLQGRKWSVSRLKEGRHKGIYIQDGRKVVVK